jgi:hypothetical protein
MRIFRQQKHMACGPVFERMAAELRAHMPGHVRAPSVAVSIAPAELIDKITILEIKAERITDAEKLCHVRAELETLQSSREHTMLPSDALEALTIELHWLNGALWDIEDAIRECERAGDFGAKFVDLARSVYTNNDRRAALKRKINVRLGSKIVDEKSYAGTPCEPSPV